MIRMSGNRSRRGSSTANPAPRRSATGSVAVWQPPAISGQIVASAMRSTRRSPGAAATGRHRTAALSPSATPR
ncbi:MAG: hypothetical protein ABT15_05005 [Pseudonocardia sp. SCN 73-27]|nr:MAG: hypothetical protein ABS80_21455 [Pseudonocardia sp. SCN 72-51]ODV08052.1 MAG: hypothetical protein ABT15_05005 [Pseudonocardia sp. SCN 73-27]